MHVRAYMHTHTHTQSDLVMVVTFILWSLCVYFMFAIVMFYSEVIIPEKHSDFHYYKDI